MKNGRKKSVDKELRVLADDFGLLWMEEVKSIIKNCKDYSEGQKEIMRIYEKVYM